MIRLPRTAWTLVAAVMVAAAGPGPGLPHDSRAVEDLTGRSRPLLASIEPGELQLVSFVMWPIRPGERADPNRSQAVVTRSVGTQLERFGLRTLLVGIRPAEATRDELRNAAQAWHSDSVEFVFDPQGEVARSFNVSAYPATLLLDARGRVVGRWDGFVPAQALAPAIDRVLGR